MFNHTTPPGKFLSICFFLFGHLIIFTWLYRYETGFMVLFYSPVFKQRRDIEWLIPFPMVSLYTLKACSLPYINDFQGVALFPESYAFWPSIGRFRGLSITLLNWLWCSFQYFFPGQSTAAVFNQAIFHPLPGRPYLTDTLFRRNAVHPPVLP
jgi:hypothetical protein